MIVSHTKRFLFIKTKKTAGSSAEIALSRYCGAGDIVLPISQEEDEFRKREYGVLPRNFHYRPRSSPVLLPLSVLEAAVRDPRGVARFLGDPRGRAFPFRIKRYPRHMHASDLKRVVAPDVWDGYLKITIERNPWDKAVSRYFWDLHFGGRVGNRSMEEHLEYLAEKEPVQLSNWKIYAEKDRILVDRVLLYEDLAGGMAAVGAELGIAGLRLPAYRAKSNSRKDKRPASEVLSDNAKKIVAQACRREIERFGYRCE